MTNISGNTLFYNQETNHESWNYWHLDMLREDNDADRGDEFFTELFLIPATNYFGLDRAIVITEGSFPLSTLPESMTDEWWPLVTDCFNRNEELSVKARVWTSPDSKEFYASVKIALADIDNAAEEVIEDLYLVDEDYKFKTPKRFSNELNDFTNPVWREAHGMTDEQYQAETEKLNRWHEEYKKKRAQESPYETSPLTNQDQRPQALMEYESNRKKGIIAWLLWLFLGVIGAHRFYLGNTGYAIAMLLLGWATIGIWPLLDGLICINRNLRNQNQDLWNRLALTYRVPLEPMPESARK